MLAQLRIKDLGVIDDALLELSPGLNVLSGETGAGKTMVVTGLSLLLGARGDSAAVRAGAGSAVVEGLLDPPTPHPSRARIGEAGGANDGELVLVRTLTAHGRSRAHVGGRSAPVGVLAEIGELLVAVHGQAGQWRLRRPEEHRVLLDDFGGPAVRGPRLAYEQEYAHAAALTAELARLRDLERDRDVEIEVLRRGLAELERLDPREDEEDDLAAEDARLGHADSLRDAAARARVALVGDDPGSGVAEVGSGAGAGDALAAARAALTPAADHDERLGDLRRRVSELGYLVQDLSSELAGYLAGLEADPARHEWVQTRRADLGALLRRHGPSTREALEWGRQAAARLDDLAQADERAQEVQTELEGSRLRLRERADELTRARRAAAEALGTRVTAELAQLAMPSARVHVLIERTPRPGPHGVDAVEIALAANPGSPPRSVAKVASGGELSRIMLAIEVVIADTARGPLGSEHPMTDPTDDPVTDPSADRAAGPTDSSGSSSVTGVTGVTGAALTTFVFDEVDAGVGGRAALAIGQRLATLSRTAQVVVVTHLPQVAAFADRHLVVRKTVDGHVTASDVQAVDGDERLAELARMMAGTDSSVARQHAAALLAQADAGRAAGDAGARANAVPKVACGSDTRTAAAPARRGPAPTLA